MGIDILGLKSKDEARLKHMLKELAELNDWWCFKKYAEKKQVGF